MKYHFMVFDEATAKRFWCKVDKRGPDECWPWLAAKNNRGYGSFLFDGSKKAASRFALINSTNRNLKGMCACHTCDNRLCCNPNHLYWGTYSDNNMDKMRRYKGIKEILTKQIIFARSHQQKLKKPQIDYMLQLLAAGYKWRELMEWYQISKPTLYRIIINNGYQTYHQ